MQWYLNKYHSNSQPKGNLHFAGYMLIYKEKKHNVTSFSPKELDLLGGKKKKKGKKQKLKKQLFGLKEEKDSQWQIYNQEEIGSTEMKWR